jgi:hypothetical protein
MRGRARGHDAVDWVFDFAWRLKLTVVAVW